MIVIRFDNAGNHIAGPCPLPTTWGNIENPRLEDLAGAGWVEYAPTEFDPATHQVVGYYVESGAGLARVEAKTQAEIQAVQQAALEQFRAACATALDQLKNDHAKSRDYGTPSLSPLASVRAKAGYPGPYNAECLIFVQWEDACQIASYQIINDVLGGKRTPPASVAAFVAELPPLVW